MPPKELIELCEDAMVESSAESNIEWATDIAQRLHDAGYRLDPYPNGKSKVELVNRIEELEADKVKLSLALYGLGSRKYGDGEPCFCDMRIGNPMVHSHSEQCEQARKALAETSTVKS